VDNSEYMRNGDFLPSRLQAQQDAVNMVCHSKTRSNPESNVGLLTLAKYRLQEIFWMICFIYLLPILYSTKVLATLTTDAGRILSKLHQVQPEGTINLLTGVRIAHVNTFKSLQLITFLSKLSLKFFSSTFYIVGFETPTREKPPHTNCGLFRITY